MKRVFCILLVLCLLPGLLGAVLTGSGGSRLAAAAAAKSHSGVSTIADPTVDEIRAKYAECILAANRFAEAPGTVSPYALGEVDADYMQGVEKYLNLYRYVAKLPEVSNSAQKNELAQHGAVLLAAIRKVTHEPTKPSGMSAEFFQKGYIGANVSNISSFDYHEMEGNYGWDYVNQHKLNRMQRDFLMFQIRDYEKSVFRSVGHRRYLLSPYIKEYGFGMADSSDEYNSYYLITTVGSMNPLPDLTYEYNYDYVAWPPSGNCPNALMKKTFPWSLSLDASKYVVPATAEDPELGDRTGIVITVTRKSDNKVWTFDQNTPDGSALTGSASTKPGAYYFNIDKQPLGFGVQVIIPDENDPTHATLSFDSNALVFHPDFEDDSPLRGVYEVRVTGIKDKSGEAVEFSYQVNFFDLAPCEHEWTDWEVTLSPSCTEGGEMVRSCTKCGEVDRQDLAALGHNWSEWDVTPASCTEQGSQSRSCSRCSITETETIPALGHDWSEWEEINAPSCTESGMTQRSCSRCDAEETKAVDPLGHDWIEGDVIEEPNCEDVGVRSVSCQRCGETTTQTIPALGHDWNEGIVRIEPSCTKEGERDVTCQRCQFPNTLMIPALGHDWDDGVVTKEASSKEEGERTFSCRRCGDTRTEAIPVLVNIFSDNLPGKYYFEKVLWAYYHDPRITGGTGGGRFSPNKTCTREQIVTFLWKALGEPEPETSECPFEDVNPKKYYYKPILWAVENKITSGVSSTKFGVGKGCTREQVVTFLWKAYGAQEPTSTECRFTDVNPKKYYFKAILWAVENKITGGMSSTKFGVGKTCTRAQVVTFLYAADHMN